MSGLYAPQYLVLPLRIQHRLPPAVQGIDLELVMAVHAGLSLIISAFRISQGWALPLALFGLAGSAPALVTTILPHFLAFWIASIPLDLLWYYYRSDEARNLVNAVVGVNMILKLVSGGAAARMLQAQGVLPDVGGADFGGRPGWLSGGTAAPFGLPGSWSGQSGSYTDDGGAHRQARPSQQQGAGVTGYTSIYDEEADVAASERDAPQVRVDTLPGRIEQHAKPVR